MAPRVGRANQFTAVRRTVEAAYIAAIAVLTALATSNPNHFRRWAWISALALCLPAMLAMLPVLYVAASTAFNVTGANNGGTSWPVTVTYVVVLTLAAVLNVVLLREVTYTRRRRRAGPAPR